MELECGAELVECRRSCEGGGDWRRHTCKNKKKQVSFGPLVVTNKAKRITMVSTTIVDVKWHEDGVRNGSGGMKIADAWLTGEH